MLKVALDTLFSQCLVALQLTTAGAAAHTGAAAALTPTRRVHCVLERPPAGAWRGTSLDSSGWCLARGALGAMAAISCRALAAVLLLLAGATVGSAFYLPGVAPQDFKKGDAIYLKVNKLSSIRTQLPYAYYTCPYCRPARIVPFYDTLGEVPRGDLIENS